MKNIKEQLDLHAIAGFITIGLIIVGVLYAIYTAEKDICRYKKECVAQYGNAICKRFDYDRDFIEACEGNLELCNYFRKHTLLLR